MNKIKSCFVSLVLVLHQFQVALDFGKKLAVHFLISSNFY